jgi:uncharacterized protein YjeT (DUF2065 family)
MVLDGRATFPATLTQRVTAIALELVEVIFGLFIVMFPEAGAFTAAAILDVHAPDAPRNAFLIPVQF